MLPFLLQFQCCGVDSGNDFSASWWRLRELAADSLAVPLSCCIQQQPAAFLDPRPINASLCQHSSVDQHRFARHIEVISIYLYMKVSG